VSEIDEPTTGGEVGEVNPEGSPPEDNRNEEVADSPIPDPTQGDTNTGDIPEAD
jgi:hypothetical protein